MIKTSKIIALTALIMTAFLLMSVTQTGAETVTQKGRIAYHLTKVEGFQVGDVPGHVVGAGEAKGLSFLDNGEIAAYSASFTFDYTKGSGTFQSYGITTYEDGSTMVTRGQATTTAVQGGKYSLFKGTYSYISGSGRFEGIKGSGSFTGKRVTSLAAGADCYVDFTGTYTLP